MILDKIAAKRRVRIDEAKQKIAYNAVESAALELAANAGVNEKNLSNDFKKALSKDELSFICEVKKASPSKGLISKEFNYISIAKEYEDAGAQAISVLTEPDFFLGSNVYLKEIAAAVHIPVLRKDFVLDSYQIYEAKILGASAVLLIAALYDVHTKEKLKDHIAAANELGMSALVETHNETEIKFALDAGAQVIGINNRNLQTFNVDIKTTCRLRTLIPSGKIAVSESGIQTVEDVRLLASHNVDAVLIGETLMRAENKKTALAKLRA
ncbi:indole-3-glycerol phosphate synthase [Spirochaetia bacterium]|nr:indole-3-glycerol phosphate synthase [Spirochaetia bacterium]